MSRFAVGPMTSCPSRDELVIAVTFPKTARRSGGAFCEFSRRHGDSAIVGVAAVVELTPAGAIARAALGFAGAGPVPSRAPAAEHMLTGQPANMEIFRAAASAAVRELDPMEDVQASRAYRQRLVAVVTSQAFQSATACAREGGTVQTPSQPT